MRRESKTERLKSYTRHKAATAGKRGKKRGLLLRKVGNMRAPVRFALAAIFAALLDASSPSAVPEIKFADLKSAVDTGNFDGIKDAGGKFGGFVVTDIPTVGYNDAVENMVR